MIINHRFFHFVLPLPSRKNRFLEQYLRAKSLVYRIYLLPQRKILLLLNLYQTLLRLNIIKDLHQQPFNLLCISFRFCLMRIYFYNLKYCLYKRHVNFYDFKSIYSD